jgi:hypothetical protein
MIPFETFKLFQAHYGGPTAGIALYGALEDLKGISAGDTYMGSRIKDIVLAADFVPLLPITFDEGAWWRNRMGAIKHWAIMREESRSKKNEDMGQYTDEPLFVFTNLKRSYFWNPHSPYWKPFIKTDVCLQGHFASYEWKLGIMDDDKMLSFFAFEPTLVNGILNDFKSKNDVVGNNFDVFQWRSEHIPDSSKLIFCATILSKVMTRYIEETGRQVVLVSDISFTDQLLSGTLHKYGDWRRAADILRQSGVLKLEEFMTENMDTTVLAASDLSLYASAKEAYSCTVPSQLCNWCTRAKFCDPDYVDTHPDLVATSFTLEARAIRKRSGSKDVHGSWLDALQEYMPDITFAQFVQQLDSLIDTFQCVERGHRVEDIKDIPDIPILP